jgi:hypothetical protein
VVTRPLTSSPFEQQSQKAHRQRASDLSSDVPRTSSSKRLGSQTLHAHRAVADVEMGGNARRRMLLNRRTRVSVLEDHRTEYAFELRQTVGPSVGAVEEWCLGRGRAYDC